MIIQNPDGSLAKEPGRRRLVVDKRHGYYAVVPAQLLERESSVIDDLIGFAFGTLGAWCLDVRVYDEAHIGTSTEVRHSC